MTDLDRMAALATIAARCEMLAEQLMLCRVPLKRLAEIRSIQKAVETLLGSYDPGGGEIPEE